MRAEGRPGQQRQLWQRQLEQHRELELLSLQSSGIGPEQHPLIAILTEAALGRPPVADGGLAVLPSLRACLAAGYRPIGSEVLFSQLSRPENSRSNTRRARRVTRR